MIWSDLSRYRTILNNQIVICLWRRDFLSHCSKTFLEENFMSKKEIEILFSISKPAQKMWKQFCYFKPNYALQPFKIAFYCSYSLMEKLHFLDFLQKKFYIIH